MPIVADQHLPGAWRSRGANAHTPSQGWPDDCAVQWGAGCAAGAAKSGRTSAFFEAFPVTPQTYIRREGATIAEAEGKALAAWQRVLACPGHEFERRHYRNGAGVCKHCNLFSTSAFEPTTLCTVCSAPTYFTYGRDADGVEHWYCEQHAHLRDPKVHPGPIDALLADAAEDEAGDGSDGTGATGRASRPS